MDEPKGFAILGGTPGARKFARSGVEQEILVGWAAGSFVDRILEYCEQDEKWTG